MNKICKKCGNYRPIFNGEWICDLTQKSTDDLDLSKIDFTQDLSIDFKSGGESYAIVDSHKIPTNSCLDELVKRCILVKYEDQETNVYVKDGDDYRTEVRKCTVFKTKY